MFLSTGAAAIGKIDMMNVDNIYRSSWAYEMHSFF